MDKLIGKYLSLENYMGSLVYGSYIDNPIEIYDNILIIPLKPLYHNNYIDYFKDFFQTFNYKSNDQNFETFNKDFSENIPVCYIICKSNFADTNLHELDKKYKPMIDKAKLFLALISSQSAVEFFKVLKVNSKIHYKTEPIQYNQTTKLWFTSNEKDDYVKKAERIIENNSFSLSLFYDSNRETNHIYKIARYFMVLESITGSSNESRKYIKSFFKEKNYSGDLNYSNDVENYSLNCDAIEISGIIRSKIFHGANLKYEYFKKILSLDEYEILIKYPECLSRHMRDLCETAFFLKIDEKQTNASH